MTAHSIFTSLCLLINSLAGLAQLPSHLQSALPKVKSFVHPAAKSKNPKGLMKVGHVIVLYMENHSFDNLYGEFPGADGISNASPASYTQIEPATGKPFAILPLND